MRRVSTGRMWLGPVLVATWLVGSAAAQPPQSFAALLTWVPIGGAERNDVSGEGSATATLVGTRLSITGTFSGLPAAVTGAKLHLGVALGARGPAIAELRVAGSADGSVMGEVSLSAEQIAALEAGRLYVQVYSEKGVLPEHATLWGWLLREDARRARR